MTAENVIIFEAFHELVANRLCSLSTAFGMIINQQITMIEEERCIGHTIWEVIIINFNYVLKNYKIIYRI